MSNASSIQTRPCRHSRNHGGHCRRGGHDAATTDDGPLQTTTMTTTIMRTMRTPMMMMIIVQMGEESTKIIHEGEDSTNPPRRREPPLPRTNTDSIPPHPRNTIQNDGSTTRIFARRWGEACSNHLPSLDLDWVHPRRKLKYTIDNLPGNIILTRIIQQSPAWTPQNLLSSSNSSTMHMNTSEIAHKRCWCWCWCWC